MCLDLRVRRGSEARRIGFRPAPGLLRSSGLAPLTVQDRFTLLESAHAGHTGARFQRVASRVFSTLAAVEFYHTGSGPIIVFSNNLMLYPGIRTCEASFQRARRIPDNHLPVIDIPYDDSSRPRDRVSADL